MRGHGPESKAARAAFTARSTSSLFPSAISVMASPVLGSIVSNVFPLKEKTSTNYIKCLFIYF